MQVIDIYRKFVVLVELKSDLNGVKIDIHILIKKREIYIQGRKKRKEKKRDPF